VLGGTEAKNIKVLADADKADNELEFKRRKGDTVVYGQTIQLLHVNTGRYLRSSSSLTSRLENRYELGMDAVLNLSDHGWVWG
jgi:hypothetical protein